MRPLVLTILGLLLISGCATSKVKKEPVTKRFTVVYWNQEMSEQAMAMGIVYVGMPKEDLAKAGYTESLQQAYRSKKNKEWVTYTNLTNPEKGLVTFYIVDGILRGWREE